MNYILYGEEHFLIRKEIDAIVERSVTFEKSMNTVYFDASKTTMEEIIADAETLPFFSEYKVIVVTNANFLTSLKDGNINVDLLDKYLDRPNESTILIFTTNEEKLDARKKIVKKLNKIGKVKSFNALNDMQRSAFVSDEIKKRNLSFSRDALAEFYRRIGYSPSRMLVELDKLAMYKNHLEKEDIELMIQRPLEDNVFDLFNALVHHNFKGAYALWKDFEAKNIDPVSLIAMLAAQYRFLHQVKILQQRGYSSKEIASELSAHPFRVEKTLENTRYLREQEIHKILHHLAQLDQQIKAGKLDKRLGFELFLMQEGTK